MAEEGPRSGPADSAPAAVTVLSDEVLEQFCVCLPGEVLLSLAASSRALHQLISASAVVWSHLARGLLGEALCQLHATLHARRGRLEEASFWRTLFRRGYEFRFARWSADLRAAIIGSAGRSATDRAGPLTGSGHCSVAIGRLVFKCGGLRPECRAEHIHTAVFDLQALTLREVELSKDSAKPGRRLRHAACEIRPLLTGGEPALLVLGGCHDRSQRICDGGLQMLHVLELLSHDGARGRWHSVEAAGRAPAGIWHHVCGSFARGKRVVVFGGDFSDQDPEFPTIAIRSAPVGGVYVLDVDLRFWSFVPTTGPSPLWRSLHAGITHCDPLSHSERLVILGGCAEHVPIFSNSRCLAEMRGHALDLNTFTWLPQPERGLMPAPRLRCAAEKVGEWLLLYGGHGDEDELSVDRSRLYKMNLRTLRWETVTVFGKEVRFPALPAATMTAGLALGGVNFGIFGLTPVPKLDVLILCSEEGSQELHIEEAADAAAILRSDEERRAFAASSDEEEGDDLVQVVMRDERGNERAPIRVSRFLLMQLLARGGAQAQADAPAADQEGEEDEEDGVLESPGGRGGEDGEETDES